MNEIKKVARDSRINPKHAQAMADGSIAALNRKDYRDPELDMNNPFDRDEVTMDGIINTCEKVLKLKQNAGQEKSENN